jgi:hypothetical protein
MRVCTRRPKAATPELNLIRSDGHIIANDALDGSHSHRPVSLTISLVYSHMMGRPVKRVKEADEGWEAELQAKVIAIR